ncbi:MAG TPA: chemotaxis protein CheA [Desulfuromonadales bacterium]|nr:chemotaxis protein CheA [Desulfuromonadales bacterium]
MSPYRDLFVSESRTHIATFGELIVRLEDSPAESAVIDELFRHAHSLKGMAATMGYDQIVAIAHYMEDLLSRVRSDEFLLLPPLADLLLEGSDALARLVEGVEAGTDSGEDTSRLVERMASFDPAAEYQPHHPATFSGSGTEIPPESPLLDLHQFRQSDSFKSIRIKTETLDHLVNITGELITNRYRLKEAVRLSDAAESQESLRQLSALLHNLRDEVFKARMLPFAFIAERFPRLVRDLARKQGKEIHFQLFGKEIELDRGILEDIAEPIVHILRNAIDHGMEAADERVMAGKPGSGTITLTVRRDKDHVEISIDDDGRGMDPELLKQKGVEKGMLSPEQSAKMTPQEAYQLICQPGFSTAATVTDISGRGVGMDAVRETVQSLSGSLTIQSQRGSGSRFVMRLPITVSIIPALIVQSGPIEIAFPLNVVSRTVELEASEIIYESGRPAFILGDTALPIRSLRQAFNLLPAPGPESNPQSVIVCDVGSSPAFSVDRIVSQQEIFVRPLRTPLSHLKGVSGATITGDGRVLFVADAGALA